MTVVAVVGGGFSGTMVAAQLARARAARVVVFEPQAIGGVAYRSDDDAHLLNVAAGNMSAWPERPDDFLDWARRRDTSVTAGSFLPRRWYGEYLRDIIGGAGVEIRRCAVESLQRRGDGWRVVAAEPLEADAVVLATGHRLPADPLEGRWTGPRDGYLADPWATSRIAAIGDEPVVLLGTGLSAVDAVCTLTRRRRTAPITGVSRRGLMSAAHAEAPSPPADPRSWLEPLMAAGPTARALVAAIRAAGSDWRAVVDGLRADTPAIWRALPPVEARRFLRHLRPFWEIHRHRMPPELAARIADLRARGLFRTVAARVTAADASDGAVELRLSRAPSLRASFIINCTGPMLTNASVPPLIRQLLDAGHITADPLDLGIRTDSTGAAAPHLYLIGTLRKGTLWESTAVPELRLQAAAIAATLGGARTRARPGDTAGS